MNQMNAQFPMFTFFDSMNQNSRRRFIPICAILIISLVMLMLPCREAFAKTIQINVNGKTLQTDVAPTISNGRTLLPLRACAEALNATVNYSADSGKITIIKDQTLIVLTLNSNIAQVNGISQKMDVKPLLLSGRTLVPLRFVSETFNCDVQWYQSSYSVNIISDDYDGSSDEIGVDIPSADSIVADVVQQINNVRQQKQIDSFTTIGELNKMAAEHSQDMALNTYLSTKSPGFGTPAQRASILKLPTTSEVVAKVNYSHETINAAVTAWLNNEKTRDILLDPSAGYIGLGAYNESGSNIVYLTAEIIPSRAYFIGMPQSSTTNSNQISLRGRSSANQETITVYKISDQNSNMYSDKKTYTIKVNGSYFSFQQDFSEQGNYAISVANQTIYVEYKE